MKKIYVVTTIKPNGLVNLFTKDSESIDKLIETELGGWNNLFGAMTSGKNTHPDEFYQCGVTKDNSKAFSILCRVIEK